MLLELDDAVKVAMQYMRDYCDDYVIDEEDEEILRQRMEQKTWLTDYDEPDLKHLVGLIMDVNPAEICSQIQSDNLKNWCQVLQVEMQMCLVKTKTDAISRNDLIAKFNSCDLTPDGGIDINEAIDIVLQSPSVQAEEAEWMPVDEDIPYGLLVECSKCGRRAIINDALEHNYCSECGAKMKK